MRIDEFTQPIDDKLPFDVVDDVAVYMRNDPMFYRKSFFPAMKKLSGIIGNGKTVDPNKALGPLVDKACEGYCNSYDINRTPADLLTIDDRKALISKLFSEEVENIRKGEY